MMTSSRNLLLLFLGISLLTFIPSIGAGFVFDFPGWQDDYNHGKFWDFINCFGYNGNHQLLHLIFYSFYKIFGIQGLPWYLFFCVLHGLNGFLLYQVMRTWSRQWGKEISPALAMLCTAIFLVHPYNIEPVVWKVCVHYLLSLMAALIILLSFSKYISAPTSTSWWVGMGVFFLSLFLLEISFVIPIFISLAGGITWLLSGEKKRVTPRLIRYISPLWGLLAGYLVLNKFTLGTLVGHYGANVHLKFNLLSTLTIELKYIVKHLFFARYFSHNTKAILFDQYLSSHLAAYLFLGLLGVLAIFYFLRIRKIHPAWHLAFFGLVVSMVYILPVMNLFFNHLQLGMNDRYSYFPLAFLCIGLASFLSLSAKKWVYIFPGVILVLSLYLQQLTLQYWHKSTEVLTSLKKDFRWYDAPYVFILNTPNDYHGIVMTCMIKGETGIDELLDYQTPRPYDGRMFDVFQYNMTTAHDGVTVEQTGPMQLKVTFAQWGNWWHWEGIGATTRETEYFKAEVQDYPYQVTFEKFPPGSVIIYQDGLVWKEFKLEGVPEGNGGKEGGGEG